MQTWLKHFCYINRHQHDGTSVNITQPSGDLYSSTSKEHSIGVSNNLLVISK